MRLYKPSFSRPKQPPSPARAKATTKALGGKADDQTGLFLKLLAKYGIPLPAMEYMFAADLGRKFRFDYCWPGNQEGVIMGRLALEVDGSIWTHGRHTRGAGWLKDTTKLNLAATLGWRMLRCTPDQLCTLDTIRTIGQALGITVKI